jgi:NAD(P)-dependent dehydrogenase (short-subunit alcohol dehydrogenase family)
MVNDMNFFDLNGKTALITGASSGLGMRFVEVLSQHGAKVILVARRIEKLNELAAEIQSKGGKAVPIQMDVADRESVKSGLEILFEQKEKIDILINNAGTAELTPVFESEDKEDHLFHETFHTNVIGVWYVTKIVANHMKDHKIDGSIINIGSVNGDLVPPVGGSAYAASKAAVHQLTRQLVTELSTHNIRINTISPGLFKTEMTERHIGDSEAVTKKIPLGFVADPKDMDALILYLASNKASRYMTGSTITIDGGVSYCSKF